MEAQVITIRGQPGSGFHFGQRGVSQEESAPCPSADTLFAAMIARLAARAPAAVEPLMEGFPRWLGGDDERAGAPPFLISSAFPFAGEVRFFPKPERDAPAGTGDAVDPKAAKRLKRVAYVSEHIFRALLEGGALGDWADRALALQDGQLWAAPDECDALPEGWCAGREHEPGMLRAWSVEKRPRVTIDRLTNASNIFHSGCTVYAQGCGMWFAIQWRDPDRMVAGRSVRAWLEQTLDDLAETGLGGLRAAGMGACTFTVDERPLPLPDPDGASWVTLSRYHPRPHEVGCLKSVSAAYRIVTVGGWVRVEGGSDQRRIPVQMLAEGSVLGPAGPGPFGDVVDARPRYGNPDGDVNHPVWRYGLAFPVGMREGGAP